MYKKFLDAMQLLNIVFQAIYTLLFPVGIGALASFLLTKYASFPSWIWAILLTLGVLMGLYSMVKYILTALKNIEALKKQREKDAAERSEKEEKQKQLREAAGIKGDKKDDK